MKKKSRKEVRKEDGSYIFPNIVAKTMRNITPRIQYESALMSLSIILVSLFGVGIFTIFFTDYSLGVKIVTGINTVAMFIFLSSNLVTTYQQYFQFMVMSGKLNDKKVIEESKGKLGMSPEDELEYIKNRNKEQTNKDVKDNVKETIKKPIKIKTISEQIKEDILGDKDRDKVIEEILNLNKEINSREII